MHTTVVAGLEYDACILAQRHDEQHRFLVSGTVCCRLQNWLTERLRAKTRMYKVLLYLKKIHFVPLHTPYFSIQYSIPAYDVDVLREILTDLNH